MALKIVSVLLLLTVHDMVAQEVDQGYDYQFHSNPYEFENVPMNFTGKAPSWLNGSLIKVGPGQFVIGEEGQSSASILDGFAKLVKWRFMGNNSILFTTKFINSTYRIESLARRKFTSNIFISPPYPPLTPEELLRSQEVGIDNMDINVVDYMDWKNNTFTLVATNDVWPAYEFSRFDLSTLRKVKPNVADAGSSVRNESLTFIKQLSTAHPLPEPNTNNKINIILDAALRPEEKNLLKVVRIKSLDQTEVIASWEIPEIPFLHSFSVSQTKVILLMNPYILNVTCMINNIGHCYHWKSGNDLTTLYVVDLHTGNVKSLLINKTFVLHHINAFDLNSDELVVDVAAYDSPIAYTKFDRQSLLNSTFRKSIETRSDLKRIHITLSNNSATINSLESRTVDSVLASTLEYPVINELNRSRPYCYIYGVVEKTDNMNIEAMGVAKKDLCAHDGRHTDSVYEKTGWYPAEPTFVPTPGALDEDDGVLLVPYTSGADKRTNLVLLNARDLTLIDMAEGPTLVPHLQHGRYFEL